MKGQISTGYLMVFLIAILLGFLVGFRLDLIDLLTHQFTSSDSQPIDAEQQNILLLGVDALTNNQPELQSIWLLIYYNDQSQVTLIPIFPDPGGVDFVERQLLEAFQLGPQGKPQPDFWLALNEIARTWWDGYILTDQTAAIAIAAALQGPAGERAQQFTNAMLDESLSSFPGLIHQTQVIKALCAGFAAQPRPLELLKLQAELGEHLVTDLDLDNLLANWQFTSRLPDLDCNFPLEQLVQVYPEPPAP